MKRFAILVLVLLILGGVVFYFGWIQIRIPADGYAVIFTRTDGWEPRVIEPGTFVWRWQRLIPTNLSLYVFTPERHRTEVQLNGTLPSGSVIKSILDQDAEFSYDLRMTVQTRILPEDLPAMARDEGVRPGDLSDYYAELDAKISQLSTETLMTLIESQSDQITLGDAYSTIVEAVTDRIERDVDHIEVVSVTPQRIDLPDMELYRTARRLSANVLETRASALEEAARDIARTRAESDRGLSLLKEYGQILDEHPVLLDYFRVAQEIEGDPLDIRSIVPESGR